MYCRIGSLGWMTSRSLSHARTLAAQCSEAIPLLSRYGLPFNQALLLRNVNRKLKLNRLLSYSVRDNIASSQLLSKLVPDTPIEALHRNLKCIQENSQALIVIKIGGDVIDHELAELVEVCSNLRKLELFPVIIHGGGPQVNAELDRLGIVPEYKNGSRITNAQVLQVAKRSFETLNSCVVDALRNNGVACAGFSANIFVASQSNQGLGFVGDVTNVDINPLLKCFKEGVVPVMTSIGKSNDGQVLNINADVAARELVEALKPARVIFASAKGGWIDDKTKKIVKTVDMANDYERLAALDYTGRQGTLLKLNEIRRMLEETPPTTSVHITSASNILKELLSNEGSGTLFCKGNKVVCSPSACIYPGDVAVAKFNRSEISSNSMNVVDSFRVAEVPRKDIYINSVWNAVKETFPSAAWTWKKNDKDSGNVLACSEKFSDFVLHGDKLSVAFYNSGSDSSGWTSDHARELLDIKENSYKSVVTTDSKKTTPAYLPNKKRLYTVGLLGARGYVGCEFVKLLCDHNNMELRLASSRALNGQLVRSCFGIDEIKASNGVRDLKFGAYEPNDLLCEPIASDIDIWVLALPNGLAPNFVPALDQIAKARGEKTVLIDLSADYRFDPGWVYGLPERPGTRELLKSATKISNPGCYATGLQASVMPLLNPKSSLSGVQIRSDSFPTVFGVSGYSGAGTTPSPKNDPQVLKDNLLGYSLTGHIHERECSHHLGHRVAFMPHVASWFRGIHLTTSFQLDSWEGIDAQSLLALYSDYYRYDKLVQVTEMAPTVQEIANKHHVSVGGVNVDSSNGRVAIVSVIDNLLKGAATQAIQNLNLALGLDEYEGIHVQ